MGAFVGLCLVAAVMVWSAGILLAGGTGTVDGLRREFLTRWNVRTIASGVDAVVAPRVGKPGMPVDLQDLAPDRELAALQLVRSALLVYPPGFVRRMLHEVVLSSGLTVWNEPVGGFYFDHTIAVNFAGIEDPATRGFDVDTVHHELSSIVRRQITFDVTAWEAINPSGFAYMDTSTYKATLRDAGSVEGDDALHRAGFVSRYGQTTLDNDWNTYAERVFGHGTEFAKQVARFLPMRRKTRILMDVYLSLDPGFAAYFQRTGLSQAALPG